MGLRASVSFETLQEIVNDWYLRNWGKIYMGDSESLRKHVPNYIIMIVTEMEKAGMTPQKFDYARGEWTTAKLDIIRL